MKKVLLIGFILAICILAFPQGVMAADDSAEVNANIEPSLEFYADGVVSVFALAAGPDTTTLDEAVTFDVTSNGAWSVSVLSADPLNGKMEPAIGESGAQPLDQVLKIWSVEEGAFVYVTAGDAILTGTNTGEEGLFYPTDMQQDTVFTDARLMTEDNHYTIELTFTCVQHA